MKESASIRRAHIVVAEQLIRTYKGTEPFSIFIKKFFSSHKKHGSNDRRQITALCFGYFRLGNGVISDTDIIERILLGSFITEHTSDNEEESINLLKEKLDSIPAQFDVSEIFPFQHSLSDSVASLSFNLSFLRQPHLFFRIRPGHQKSVSNKLLQENISFRTPTPHCVEVPNTTQLQNTFDIDKEIVIQDYSSQKVADLFEKIKLNGTGKINVWDCCAGSGGKSILVHDFFKNIQLTVSDKRKSILHNLEKRFSAAGIRKYQKLILDASLPFSKIPGAPFDLIVADVPCSGSGTWARTPEQLKYFDERMIAEYVSVQQSIVLNAAALLKPQGYLLYITCSVFKRENEENTRMIAHKTELLTEVEKYFTGYDKGADTLYAALLKKMN